MKPKTEQFDIGVIVARFQVHELHPAQRELIAHVCREHDKVVILLGLSPLVTTLNNPLDFEARKQMILAEFPDVNVLYVRDQFDDDVWSRKLDEIIADLAMPGQSVVLYGGRDSFIPHYKGRFPTRELQDTEDRFLSGTAVRKAIGRAATKGSPDFRAGVIWASQARFPTAYQCVDIAPLRYEENVTTRRASESWRSCRKCQPRTACPEHKEEAASFYAPPQPTQVLLGRKPNETKFRFLGGFSDPRSESLEIDAIRETAEEANVEIGDVKYIGSTKVPDWRYRDEPDCIKTALFVAKVLHGKPRPGDDIEEVRWFDLPTGGVGPETRAIKDDKLDWHKITPAHRTLLKMLVRHLKGETR